VSSCTPGWKTELFETWIEYFNIPCAATSVKKINVNGTHLNFWDSPWTKKNPFQNLIALSKFALTWTRFDKTPKSPRVRLWIVSSRNGPRTTSVRREACSPLRILCWTHPCSWDFCSKPLGGFVWFWSTWRSVCSTHHVVTKQQYHTDDTQPCLKSGEFGYHRLCNR